MQTKEEINEYKRKWAGRDKEKVKASKKKWAQANRAQQKEYRERRKQERGKEDRKYQREWMQRKRAKIKASLTVAEKEEIEVHRQTGRFKKGQVPWSKGKKGVLVAWNKGLSKETDERVRKLSEKVSRSVYKLWQKPGYKGGNKKGVSFYTREMREAQSRRVRGEGNPMYGVSGALSPVWKGGISFAPYPPEFNSKLKWKIKKRDGYKCQLCGTKEKLAIHHIDYVKGNCGPDNLITLCLSCNARVNKDREKWTAYFRNLIK